MKPPLFSCLSSRVANNGSLYGRFLFGPLPIDVSLTVATVLRRSLLHSQATFTIVSAEIEGAYHEYASLPGIQESILEILLNLGEIVLTSTHRNFVSPNFRISGQTSGFSFAFIRISGPGIVTAKDINWPKGIFCVKPNAYIATLSSNETLTMRLKIACSLNKNQESLYESEESPKRSLRIFGHKESTPLNTKTQVANSFHDSLSGVQNTQNKVQDQKNYAMHRNQFEFFKLPGTANTMSSVSSLQTKTPFLSLGKPFGQFLKQRASSPFSPKGSGSAMPRDPLPLPFGDKEPKGPVKVTTSHFIRIQKKTLISLKTIEGARTKTSNTLLHEQTKEATHALYPEQIVLDSYSIRKQSTNLSPLTSKQTIFLENKSPLQWPYLQRASSPFSPKGSGSAMQSNAMAQPFGLLGKGSKHHVTFENQNNTKNNVTFCVFPGLFNDFIEGDFLKKEHERGSIESINEQGPELLGHKAIGLPGPVITRAGVVIGSSPKSSGKGSKLEAYYAQRALSLDYEGSKQRQQKLFFKEEVNSPQKTKESVKYELPVSKSSYPVEKVNFLIERDDELAGYRHRIILEVWTNGSISPRQAIFESIGSIIKLIYNFREPL